LTSILERATRLQREASEVMQSTGLGKALEPLGEIVYTGSYFLDLMVYPDLDLYLPKMDIERIFSAAGQVATDQRVVRVSFENELHPGLEGGLYLNFRINLGEWGRPWKVDIWWLDKEMIQEKMGIMIHFKQLLTPDLREQILRYKYSLLNDLGRTPMYSGYHIYRAFLDEGLRDPGEVTRYLVAKGIKIE